MKQSPPENGSQTVSTDQAQPGRLVYIMPEHAVIGPADDEMSLRDLWTIMWRGKWIIVVVTAAFAVSSVVYALAQTHWYRAEVLLAPADAKSTPSLGGQLGGLAALAGVSVGGGESAEYLAVLKSREFARAFIEEHGLLQVFFADDWDEEKKQWRGPDPVKWPDTRDAVKYFQDDILDVREDTKSRLVTIAIEWTDPEVAAEWATTITDRLNARLRERALLEAEVNVAYLQGELAQTNVVTLQQSIGRLLEAELQKLMLARGNEEFAFRIIDSAEAPKTPSRPRRLLIAVLGTVLGAMVAVFGVFIYYVVGNAEQAYRAPR